LQDYYFSLFEYRKTYSEEMDRLGGLWGSLPLAFLLLLGAAFNSAPGANAWSKEGHMITCKIAQVNFNSNLRRLMVRAESPLLEDTCGFNEKNEYWLMN